MISAPLFYGFAIFIMLFSLCVLFSVNPIFSALSLAASMIGLAGIFFALGAHFIAAVQLAVYAGAVMVLFVMVLMLFDVNDQGEEKESPLPKFLKLLVVGVILGLITGAITLSGLDSSTQLVIADVASITPTKQLAILLFDKYLFAFEALGVLLLVIAIGVVSVSRIKGGTHAKS